MATIKNVIRTIFTAEGAGSAIRDVDHLGRAQTRLGQTSASAGRSFAAQSQGLGGLVAAYAGAAATTFALQQAYDKLAKSARTIQTLEGLTTLAAKSAIDGKSLLTSVQQITKSQLSLASAAEQVNLALSAGFDSKQIEGLSTVALKASRALGRDLTDAMTRVTRGSAKMETELLDELGIYTKIGPATRAYAMSIGKASSELTEYERRQAFVNSVIAEGNSKFKSINATIPTTAEKLEAFGTKIVDLATKFGMVIAEVVAPAMDFLTNNLSASISAFGMIAGLVAGKGISVFREGLDKAAISMTGFGNSIERRITSLGGASKVIKNATIDVKSFNEQNMKLNFEEKAQYAAIKKTADARVLNRAELIKANTLMSTHLTKLQTEQQAVKANYTARYNNVKSLRSEQQAIRDRIATLKQEQALKTQEARSATNIVDRSFANAQLAAINQRLIPAQASLTQKTQQLKLAVSGARTELTNISGKVNTYAASIEEAKEAQKAFNTAISNKAVLGGGGINAFWAGSIKGIAGFTRAVTSAAGKAVGLFQFVTIFNLIGSSIANLLGKSLQYEAFVAKIGGAVRTLLAGARSLDFSSVAQGVAAGSLADLEKVDAKLAQINSFKFKDKFLGFTVDIEKTKEQLVAEVSDILSKMSSDEPGKRLGEALTTESAGWGATIGSIIVGGIGAYFGGPAGLALGLQLGGALGAGVGAWLTADTSVLEDAAADYGDIVTKRFAKELANIADPKLQEKTMQGLSLLMSKYSELALVNPQARAALETQAKMILQSSESTQYVEAFSQIMLSTGLTSDIIAKNFSNITTDAQKASGYISEFSTKIGDKEIKFTFIDQYSPEFKNILTLLEDGKRKSTVDLTINLLTNNEDKLKNIVDSYYGNMEAYAGVVSQALTGITTLANMQNIDLATIDAKDFRELSENLAPQLKKGLEDAQAAGVSLLPILKMLSSSGTDMKTIVTDSMAAADAAQQQSIRVTEALRSLNSGVREGTISYENYTKGIGEVRSGLNSLKGDVSKAEEANSVLNSLFNNPNFTALLPPDQLQALQTVVDLSNDRVEKLKEQAAQEEALYNSLKGQDEILKNILNTQLLLAAITPKRKTKEQQYFDLTTVSAPEEKKTLINIDYSLQVAQQNAKALASYMLFQKQVSSINTEVQDLMSNTTTSNVETQIAALNKVASVAKATYSDTSRAITIEFKNGTTGVLNLVDDVTKANADIALSALESVYSNAQIAYEQTVSFMGKKTEEYKKGIITLKEEAKDLANEKLKLTLQIEIDKAKASRDLKNTLDQLKLEKMQLELQLVQAKAESGTITKQEGLDQQNTKEQDILKFRAELIQKEYMNAVASSRESLRLAELNASINKQKIESERDLQISAIENDKAFVTAMSDALKAAANADVEVLRKRIDTTNTSNQKFIDGLTAALTEGAAAIGTAIKTQGEQLNVVGTKNVTVDYALPQVDTYFKDVTSGFTTAADGYVASIRANADTQLALEEQGLQAAKDSAKQEWEAARAVRDAKLDNMNVERQLQTENHKTRVNELAKEGADEAKKRAEALKKLQDDYAKAIEGVTKVLLEMLQSIVKQIGEIVTKSLERKVEMAKRKEEIVNSLLTRTTEKLTEATSKQQEALNEEISLRKEVEDSIKSLAEIQKTYIDSLTGDDRSIKESSKALIAGILDQKKKQIDLSRTISQRLRLDTQVKTLEERKLELEKQLEAATAAREAAEQRLASAQQFVAQLTDLVSGNMFTLSQSLQQFAQAIAQVQAVVNQGLSDGFTSAEMMGGVQGFANNIINSLLTGSMGKGTFSNAINGLLNAGKVLNSAGSKIATAVGSSAPLTSIRPQARPTGLGASSVSGGFWGTVGSAIGGALNGFGIGNLVGALTNDPGFGSSIGGAIGGAIGTVFASQLVTAPIIGSLAAGIGGALGMAANLVIPGIGAVIGALIGRLFSKTPKASATGQLTASGFTTTSTSQQKMPGGTAQKLADISGDTLTQFVDTLKAAGIAFKDVVNTSVSMKKDQITGASLSFAGGQSFSFGGTKADQAGVQKLAQFYLDSFIKGLRQGSLVVDKTIKGAATLQAAIDKFASSSNGTKTIERLQEAITYAENFSKIIDSLGQAVPVSMEGAIAQINEGAASNASAIASYYTDLKKQAADFLGTSAADYAILTKAIKANALAQLGLAQDTDGSLKSIEAATAELNAGSLAIANIVAGISSFSVALTAAGFSLTEATRIVDYALNNQLSTFIGTIGKNLQDSIDILKNPATQSSIELAAIIDNAQERNKQAEGVLSELNKTASKISASTIDKAIQNVAKSAELGALEVQAYLESLDIAQLKAVIADTARIDSTTRLAAETRLAALQEADRAQALKQFIKSSREFNKALFEITQSASSPEFLGVATSALEIADKLGKTSIDTASSNIASYINNVAKGIDIVDNASNTIAALNAEYSASNITATQYVEVLDILQETTLDSVETLKSLVTSISDTTQEIYDMYTSSMDNLLTATEDVGSRFSDLLDTFKEQTMTILGIFDDTLKDVADSGNKLYDLRDTAKDAFQSAADAVTEFEKNNKLSGKTSAQLTADLSAVATKIAALSGTSVDFASFLQLATLTSQQRSLQSELTKVNSIQEEYTKLINARAAAEADYNYAKATVTDLEASATAKLIDTRITESETVQQVKEAAYDFITSQKDLKDITQLLTAANFNLNQVRFEERDRVVQVAEALQSVTTTAKSINEETAALNATTLASVQATARLNAELKYGATATTLITEAVNDATASFNSLKTVSASVQTAVRDIINIGTVTSTTTTAQISGIYDAIVTSIKNAATAVKITDSLLTDSFDGYSATITGYLTNIKTALGTAFDATDTTKYNAFVANITTTQNALNLITPTLTAIATGAASLATVTTASASISENISTFKDSIVYAVQNLLEAFSTSRKDKIDAFRESLEKLDAIGITINSTTGLKQALIDVNTKASDTASSVTTLATNFTKLSTALAGLFDTTTGTTTVKGLITQANDAIVGLATRLKTAWDAVVLNTQTAVSGSIVVSTSLSSGDSAKLGAVQTNTNTIAKNSGLFPALQALGTAGYVAGSIPGAAVTYAATGGYIEGPGSATSDSIPARLSNGEYVIKASSVKNVGKDVLDSINETGNLGYALSNMGRRGDSLVAHINSEEARLLRSKGGSGTFNPRTGLLEFFNKDGGAPANLFGTQEAAKLFTDFNSSFVTKTPIASVAPGGFIRMDTAAGSAQFYPYNQGEASRLMGGNTPNMQELFSQIGNAAILGSRPLVARGVGDVNKISYGIGAVGANASNKALNNIKLQTSNKGVLTDTLAGIGPEKTSTGAVQLGGIIGRVNEVLRLLAKSYGRALTTNADVTVSSGTSLQKAVVEDYVKSLNETNKNLFFDYYMLKGASSRNKAVRKNVIGFADTSAITSYANRETLSPTTYTLASSATSGTKGFAGTYTEALRKQANYTPVDPFSFGGSYAGTITGAGAGLLGFSSGGLVTSPRDSVSAMLEPGEFVLRKQAVDRMGVDNAIRLNSTGDVGNGDVEVNINNNGTSQTTVGTPEVRRENGKIIIDIILEDLRNNGPIKRQIRSMR